MSEAADRVRWFLDRRKKIQGLDPVLITSLDGGWEAGGFDLTVDDLEELLRIASEYEILAADVREMP